MRENDSMPAITDESIVERVAEAMFEQYHGVPFADCVANRDDWLAMALAAVRTINGGGLRNGSGATP